MEFDASLLVIMGIFWITYLILKTFFFRPLERIVVERETEVESSRQLYESALAETSSRIAEERGRLSQARVEAAARRDALRRQAEERRQQVLAEAKAAAEGQVASAQAELTEEVAGRRGELEKSARTLADRMTDRLLRKAV